MTIAVDNEKCDRCGTCIGVCPSNALVMLGDRLAIEDSACTGCSRCVLVCPYGALALRRPGAA